MESTRSWTQFIYFHLTSFAIEDKKAFAHCWYCLIHFWLSNVKKRPCLTVWGKIDLISTERITTVMTIKETFKYILNLQHWGNANKKVGYAKLGTAKLLSIWHPTTTLKRESNSCSRFCTWPQFFSTGVLKSLKRSPSWDAKMKRYATKC